MQRYCLTCRIFSLWKIRCFLLYIPLTLSLLNLAKYILLWEIFCCLTIFQCLNHFTQRMSNALWLKIRLWIIFIWRKCYLLFLCIPEIRYKENTVIKEWQTTTATMAAYYTGTEATHPRSPLRCTWTVRVCCFALDKDPFSAPQIDFQCGVEKGWVIMMACVSRTQCTVLRSIWRKHRGVPIPIHQHNLYRFSAWD